MAPIGPLCRQDSQGHQARRLASRAADQPRTGHQPQDRQGARPQRVCGVARPRRRGDRVKRRAFITLLGGAAATWPLAARAQQPERMRRIGVLMHLAADDLEGQARFAAFLQGLQRLGWTDGRNLRIDTRWGANDADRRRYAGELVALAPDVILASATPATLALQQATRTMPIVFANVADPVGAGIVESLSRPGGNVTGFAMFEYSLSVKWLELLKEIAPRVTRAAVILDAANPGAIGHFAVIQTPA